MTAKEELKQYRYARYKVDDALLEYQKYKTRAEKMTSVISGEPKGGGIRSDKVGDNASAMADMAREYEQRWIQAEQSKLELEKRLDKIPEPHRTLLHLRYIENKDFNEIAEGMNYSYVRVTHLHGEALMIYEKEIMTNVDNS